MGEIGVSSVVAAELAYGVVKSGSSRNRQALEMFLAPLIILPFAARGGHPLLGFQRQLAQRCGLDAKRLQGTEQSLDRVGSLRLLTQSQQQGLECLFGGLGQAPSGEQRLVRRSPQVKPCASPAMAAPSSVTPPSPS